MALHQTCSSFPLFFLNTRSFMDRFSKYITLLFLEAYLVEAVNTCDASEASRLPHTVLNQQQKQQDWIWGVSLAAGIKHLCRWLCAQTFLSAVKKTNPTSPWADFLRYLHIWGLTWMKHQDSFIQEVLEGCIKPTINTSQLPLSVTNSTFIPRR